MDNFRFLFFLYLLLPLLTYATSASASAAGKQFLPLLTSVTGKQVYLVYFGGDSAQNTVREIEENHHSYLLSVKGNGEDAKRSLIYSYRNINALAAILTGDEASRISELEGVVSVTPSRTHSLQTTRSWEFTSLLGGTNSNNLEEEEDHLLLKSKYGNDVIIGVIDSGVWPESESFDHTGMGPVPESWKGVCESGDAFNSSHCNKKIIGARYFIKTYEEAYGKLNRTLDYLSPRDKDGHGTHTSSTAGGRAVQNVSAVGGYALGIATGGAPLARLAIYKVCWPEGCVDTDILAAIDQAITDGVDVLSISYGITSRYDVDPIAIGALHAVKKNIVVAGSAGNYGPNPGESTNVAPWIITVGASSVDRKFVSRVVLGNATEIAGESVSPYKLENKSYPLAYAGQVVNPNVSEELSGQCLPGSLSPKKAKGKIILCFGGNGSGVGKGMEVKRAGGVGLILGNSKANGNYVAAEAHLLPATTVSYGNALDIYNYIKSAKESKAYIVPADTILGTKPSPFMAPFSSRGPNAISPDILKPDITAPGINILAAWSGASKVINISSTTCIEGDRRRVIKYKFMSGTSVSCPHVAGALALIKGAHPEWSSAAIRSALMTSATLTNTEGNLITDEFGNPADPFQFGSGHFRPTKAVDPGLVYDASYTDYLLFLCSSGYKDMDPTFKCPENPPSPANLNYPSLAIPKLNDTITVVRTVKNVGCGQSVYTVNVKPPPGISITISPPVLIFTCTGHKKSFTITVKKDGEFNTDRVKNDGYLFGWYTLSDGIHSVRSSIAVAMA